MGFGSLLMVIQQFPMMKMKWKVITKRQEWHLHYFVHINGQLAHIQYFENVKSVCKTFCGVHEAKIIENKLFFQRRFFTIKIEKRGDLLVHINMVKVLADQLSKMLEILFNSNPQSW
jgi:hypothetical protein